MLAGGAWLAESPVRDPHHPGTRSGVAEDSGEFALLDRTLSYPRRVATSANVLATGSRGPGALEQILFDTASADFGWGIDSDFDGIPDEVESLLGTQAYYYDSDGDGSRDALEWMSRFDPLNPESVPTLAPVMRVFGYVAEGSNSLRVFVSLFPFEFLDSIQIFLGSSELQPTAGGTLDFGIFDFNPLLLSTLVSVTRANQAGVLSAVTFTFELPLDVIDALAPLSVGLSASLAGSPLVDQITMIPGGENRLVVQSEALYEENPQGSVRFSAQPLVAAGSNGSGGGGGGPGIGGEGGGGSAEPQYCQTNLGGGLPNGFGGVEFSVNSAACVPDGLLFCVGADCSDLVGATIVIIDYGFLQDQAGN